jgi:hypothetical protein
MNETLQILEKLNSFYNSAYSNLVLYTTALLAFAGGLIPFIISIYQNRQFRVEQSRVREEMKIEIDAAVNELSGKLDLMVENAGVKIEEKVKKLEIELRQGIASAEGGNYHVQGIACIESKDFCEASESINVAIREYIKANDEFNLKRVIDLMNDNILPKMNDVDFNDEIDEGFTETLRCLEGYNQNKRYSDSISDIKSRLREARKRTKQVG